MEIPDLTAIIINLSASLLPVINVLIGLSYVIGLFFVYIAITRFKKIAERHAQYPSQEHAIIPLTYLFVGAALILLPETIKILSATAFGTENIIAYTTPQKPTFQSAIMIFFKAVGFIWVIRGAVLIASSTQPGVGQGSKGLTFLIGGIFTLNIEGTLSGIDDLFTYIMKVVSGTG